MELWSLVYGLNYPFIPNGARVTNGYLVSGAKRADGDDVNVVGPAVGEGTDGGEHHLEGRLPHTILIYSRLKF